MKKSFFKYAILCFSIFLIFSIISYSFIKKYLYNSKITETKTYIKLKKELIKNNIDDSELIKFRDYYNLEKIFYVKNGTIQNSSLITEKGKKFDFDILSSKYKNESQQKLELRKEGLWINKGKFNLRYYFMPDEESFLIIDINIKDEIKFINKTIYVFYLYLLIFFILVFSLVFLYYFYNFYFPMKKTVKYLKSIEDPIMIKTSEKKLIITDTDFRELEQELFLIFDKVGNKIDRIEKDRQAMKKVYETMSLKNRQILSLYEFAKTLSFDLELKTIYEKIVDIMIALMRTKAIVIMLLKENKTYEVDFIYGISNYRNTAKVEKAEDIVIKTGKTLRIKETDKDKKINLSSIGLEDREILKSCFVVPLKNKGEVNGIMIVDSIFEGKLSNSEEMMTMGTVGEIIGRAVDKALKYREMNIGLNISSILYKITTLVETNKNLDGIFQEIIKSIKKVVDYTSASIYMLNEKNELKEKPEYREGDKDELLESIEFKLGNGIKALVAQKKETIIIKDARKSSKDFSDIFSEEEKLIASFASVPMIVGDKLVGVLNLAHREPYRFQEEDKKILKVFANQAASTISKILSDRRTEELLAKVTNESITDPLTQAYNRRYMMRRLSEEMERSKRERNFMGLLAIDIDFFKKFNDTYGHQTGDYVLQQVTEMIKKSVRVIDIVCRYGGEEFFVILPNTTRDGAYITSERIRKTVENNKMLLGETVIYVTVSIGVGIYPISGDSIENIIKTADMALYNAKERGRNKVVIYGE